jgi:hypothetical protein
MTERHPPERLDGELRSYLRSRMAAEFPADLMRDVMTDVHRTTQARRGSGWPILGALAAVAVAAVLVVASLGLLDRGDVGASPSPSPSVSAVPSPSASPSGSAAGTESPSSSPSPEPTVAEGEFGPIHSMTPEEAFGEAQTCEVPNVTSNAQPTGLSYSISFPAGWFANEATPQRDGCTVFASEPFELGPDSAVPESAEITIDVPPGGAFDPTEPSVFTPDPPDVTTEEYTVSGVAALRHEYAAEPGSPARVVWIVAIAGNLPGTDNDRPYLFITTLADGPEHAAELIEVIDRMVATLVIGG